jgi:hypothetical protein
MMKKVALVLALVVLVIGIVASEVAVAGAKSKAGSVVMETYGGQSILVQGEVPPTPLLDLSFGEVKHVSLTVPAGTLMGVNSYQDRGWVEVLTDMDGDGVCESRIAPLGTQNTYCGLRFGASYQFDAYGFVAEAFERTSPDNPAYGTPWECRANATVTWVK